MWRTILIISQQNYAAEGKFKPAACDQELGIGFVIQPAWSKSEVAELTEHGSGNFRIVRHSS